MVVKCVTVKAIIIIIDVALSAAASGRLTLSIFLLIRRISGFFFPLLFAAAPCHRRGGGR